MIKVMVVCLGVALSATPFAAHCAAPTSAAPTGAGEARLDAFLGRVQTLRADFTQTVVDTERRVMQEASGTLAVRRPGRFRWDYREPFVQVIVADGSELWMYDAELAQVTVRPLDQTLASTPAMLLSGDGDIRAHSDLEELGEGGGMTWLGLVPHERETEFESVRIGFRGADLAVMELVDGFGQTTRITFENMVRNVSLDDDVFTFTPPPGADVIR